MKPANLITPSWWYLIAAVPLGGTWYLTHRLLEAESYKYTFGGLRNVIVLGAVQIPSLLGILALAAVVMFFGSAFDLRFHNQAIQKIISSAALILYGWWSLQMALWVLMK